MKANRQIWFLALTMVIGTMAVECPPEVSAQTGAPKSSGENHGANAARWSVQVNKVDAGDVNLEPAFRIAIYENLLDELAKTKRFKQVLRDGDRKATDISNLLILKTVVQKYTPGSETRRAVTTVSGATKLTVRSQLCTPDGATIVERTVNGNVRFMGSNLRATHNLSRNVAKAIKQTSLPEPQPSAPLPGGQI